MQIPNQHTHPRSSFRLYVHAPFLSPYPSFPNHKAQASNPPKPPKNPYGSLLQPLSLNQTIERDAAPAAYRNPFMRTIKAIYRA